MKKFNFKQGPLLGQKLKKIENEWLENKFNISEEKVAEIVNN